jgi:acyl-CoA dehydrogenase
VIPFAPIQEQALTVQMTRTFAAKVLRPAARIADETETLPDALLKQSWQLGLIATQIPEAYGGAGEPRSPVTNALVLEALAFGDLALALAITHSAAFPFAVLDQGSEEQKRRLLPSFCATDPRPASLAVMEPVPGFDPYQAACIAKPTDNGFVLSGTKCCVPLAENA